MGSSLPLGVAGLALVLAVLALVLATLANRRWARRAQASVVDPSVLAHLESAVAELRERTIALRGELAGVQERGSSTSQALAQIQDEGRTALRRVAVVRYDAFADVGGRLSYSAAILDDTSSGLVITALSGKSDIRTYVKPVSAGAGQSPLTPEEQQAVAAAAGSNP
jgi:hypothetical protein